jgi:UDP-glucuronate 4-epimerase
VLKGVPVRRVIHLAAQAGVRHSLTHPEDYVSANLAGHLNILEYCRRHDGLEHLTYASSSSVYGGSKAMPFRESDPADKPVSLYAATKRADEMMSHSYAHLYGLPQTGLRYFTVYGPWGRPDMAMWIFADALLSGRPIDLFDEGRGRRDFTYIDDAVAATLDVAAQAPSGNLPHRVYNVGSDQPEKVTEIVGLLETALERRAEVRLLPAQPGDVPATHADLTAIRTDFGYAPKTPITAGVPRFASWFKAWRERNG